MKKDIALVVVLMFAAIVFVGCAPSGEKKAETASATSEAAAVSAESKTVVATKEVVKPDAKVVKAKTAPKAK